MKKRTLAWIGITVVALFATAFGAWSIFGNNEISMTQQELQSMIDSKSPFPPKYGVTLDNATLDLSGGEIGVIVDAQAEKFGTKVNATGKTRGSLTYNAAEGSFYFVPSKLEITKLEANGDSVTNKVADFVDKWIDSPKIQANKDEVAKMGSDWANAAILKTAEFSLKRIPVYKLPNDFKGNAAKMFLTDVEVRGDTVVAHLSFMQFTKMLLLYGLALVLSIGFAVALIMNPELGAAVIILGSFGN